MMACLAHDVAVQIVRFRVQITGRYAAYSKIQGSSIGDGLDHCSRQGLIGIASISFECNAEALVRLFVVVVKSEGVSRGRL
jgi:hypothetical protein